LGIQHEHFEELCALAITSQIAPDDLRTLRAHLEACAECRHVCADFELLSRQVLPALAVQQQPDSSSPGMTARFIARAHSEGIPLPNSAKVYWFRRSRVKTAAYSMAAMVLLTIAVGVLARKGALQPNAAPQRQTSTDLAPTSNLSNVAPVRLTPDDTALTRELEALRDRIKKLTAEVSAEQQALQSAQTERAQEKAELTQTGQKIADLQAELAERNQQLSAAKSEVNRLWSLKDSGDIRLQAKELELANLRNRVEELTATANDTRQLSAAAEQAKDLIVARNLHIIDVHDNANGKGRKPFGRIFYTEGQRLVFYAYDLGDPQLMAKVSFFVWGENLGDPGKVRHLGVLHLDDTNQSRWVVTFDDRNVLSEINTVFVTAESNQRKITKPNGNKLLVAFLAGEPNHP
jgi:hypothetical protein